MGTLTPVISAPATSVSAPSVMSLSLSRMVAVIGACQGCGACLLTCPEHAIRPRGGELLVRADRCSGCGECVEVCPVDAIELVECGADVDVDVNGDAL